MLLRAGRSCEIGRRCKFGPPRLDEIDGRYRPFFFVLSVFLGVGLGRQGGIAQVGMTQNAT